MIENTNNKVKMLKITSLKIRNIGPIADLKIDFDPKFNIICGPNGIGKTTVLNTIAINFSFGNIHKIRKKVNSDQGEWTIGIKDDQNQVRNDTHRFQQYSPYDTRLSVNIYSDLSKYFIHVPSNRVLEHHIELENLQRDPDQSKHSLANQAETGFELISIKKWIVNRYVLKKMNESNPNTRGNTQVRIDNFNSAIKAIDSLTKSVSFGSVDTTTFDVMMNTPSGEVFFEYLSSGFQTCVNTILGIIQQIDYRFADEEIPVSHFSGVIMIDEIDAKLHPVWHWRLCETLKELLPNVQFILTTHSPLIVQSADGNQLICLKLDENNEVTAIDKSSYLKTGFQGWTIEEILKDVMGVSELKSKLLNLKLTGFQNAIDNEDQKTAKSLYSELSDMLHEGNPLIKLLSIQLSTI